MAEPEPKLKSEVDNSDTPFKPSLRSKPNAIEPLKITEKTLEDGTIVYSHPYDPELSAFTVPSCQLESSAPIPPSDIDSSPDVIFVDDDESLARMVADLEKVDEIAIDTEFHDYRSFLGVLCVVQLSTRTQDYVIDAIKLKNELEVLNKFFTDPKVLKVMHAGENDLPWLQKDLNLYVVNMFDTRQAALKLRAAESSLTALLKKYCDVSIVKARRFQRFYDWRTRPLPSKAIAYARGDTHYLLYLHDTLRNKLITESIESNFLLDVYEQSTNLCKRTYTKPRNKLPEMLRIYPDDHPRRYALKTLYEWRDAICREEDESTGYVLPNWALRYLVARLSGREPENRKVLERASRPMTPKCAGQFTELFDKVRCRSSYTPEEILLPPKKNKETTQPLATQVDKNGKAEKKPETSTENLLPSNSKKKNKGKMPSMTAQVAKLKISKKT